MIFPSAGVSRAEALALVASEFSQPISLERLSGIARALAPLAAGLDPTPSPPPPGLREQLAAELGPEPQAGKVRAARQAMLLVLDICAEGTEPAMARRLRETEDFADGATILRAIGGFLDATGLARDLSVDSIQRLAAGLERRRAGPGRAVAALQFLGLSKTACHAARRAAFEGAAIPLLRTAAQSGDLKTMLAVEALAYEQWLKTVETPQHHTEALSAIEAAFDLVPQQPWPQSDLAPHAPPRVAFLIPNGVMLAHTEVLLSFLAGLAQLESPPIEPLVVIYAADGGELGQRLTRLKVRWATAGPATDQEDVYERVRAILAQLGADAVVVVSLPLHLAYFCRRPLGPTQIWWSMKFPLANFPRLDGRVFYRSLFDRVIEVDGRLWRGGPLAFTPPAAPDPAAVAAIRARFPGKRILGTIAREEKIAHPAFLAAITDVLKRHPDCCFLWTGRIALAEVQDAFASAGVADRCHFVGWVDPASYIMAFDLFVETYPLTGLMSGWAMSLGKPVVSVGAMGFIGAYLEPLLSGATAAAPEDLARVTAIFDRVGGRLPGLWARGPEEIGAFVDALLADPGLAADLGAAQKAYVAAFMADEAGSARVQAQHFADIVREAVARRRQASAS